MPPSTAPALTHRQFALFRSIMLHGNLSRVAEATGASQPSDKCSDLIETAGCINAAAQCAPGTLTGRSAVQP